MQEALASCQLTIFLSATTLIMTYVSVGVVLNSPGWGWGWGWDNAKNRPYNITGRF